VAECPGMQKREGETSGRGMFYIHPCGVVWRQCWIGAISLPTNICVMYACVSHFPCTHVLHARPSVRSAAPGRNF